MTILQSFKFFEESNAPVESNILSNIKGEEMIIQAGSIAGAFKINVYTRTDIENGNFVKTQVIGKSPTMGLFNEITAEGIYSLGIAGVREVKLELVSGSLVNAFATIVG